jgi:hypothetical protein
VGSTQRGHVSRIGDLEPNPNNQEQESYWRKKKRAPAKAYEQYEHSTDGQHRTAEQYNWRRQNMLTFFTTVAAIFAAVFAFKTFIQAKRQADIAQNALIASSRPWVRTIDATVTKLEVQKDQVFAWVDFSYKAIGPSPATAVMISPKLLIPSAEPFAFEEVRKLCAEEKASGEVTGDALFPGEDGNITNGFGRPMSELISARDAILRRTISGWAQGFGDEEARSVAPQLARAANFTDFGIIVCLLLHR